MLYTPISSKYNIDNPADKFSRIFVYKNCNEETIIDDRKQYFEVDTETSLKPDNNNDQQVVAWSIAPKMSPYSKYAVCSTVYTDNNTAITGLFDTLVFFGCNEIYAYFHYLDYDGMFILNWLIKEKEYSQVCDVKLTYKNAKENENKFGLLYNGGIYEIRVIYKGKCLIFRDSMKLWNTSINAVSKELIKINEKDIKRGEKPSFPLVRLKENLKYDYDTIRNYGDKVSSQEAVYMLNDVLVGVSILQMFDKFGSPGISCSGMAYKSAVKSFQRGVLTAEVVKYLLKTKFNEISENHEFESYIKVIVSGDETHLFAKNYYTINYYELTKQSKEYICSFKTIYLNYQTNSKIRALTDIQKLLDLPELRLPQLIQSALKNATEFEAVKSTKNNVVFKTYWNKNSVDFAEAVMRYINLRRLKGLEKTKRYRTAKQRGIEGIKSYDYYYQSVFKPLSFEEDADIRPAYKGGLSAAVELYSNQLQHNVVSIDINSSYPYQMQDKEMPYGEAKIFEDVNYDEFMHIQSQYKTYIIQFQTGYQLQKPNNPMVSKKSMYGYAEFSNSDSLYRQITENEYIYMTNVEFTLFCKTHNVKLENVYFKKIWAYQSFKGIFSPFVSKLYRIKQYYKGTAMYEPVKQMLNSVYGRYAMNRFKFDCYNNISYLDDKKILRFKTEEKKEIDWRMAKGSYLPVSIFITSYARVQLIETANAINEAGGRVFYYDTDSIHFTADNIRRQDGRIYINNKAVCHSDETALGDWKLEIHKKIDDKGNITGVDNAMFVCSKRYIETDEEAGINNIRCAGVPGAYKADMTINDIMVGGGAVTINKKKRTETGIILKQAEKLMEFQKNIYKTSSGMLVTEAHYLIGDKVKDMYNETSVIEEIVYKTKEKRSFNFI